MRRLTILLAALGALLLVPASQAFALGNAHVSIAGQGKGEVSSVGGVGAFESENTEYQEFFEGFGNAYEGSPPIQCTYSPQAGTCETADVEDIEEVRGIALHAIAASGSEFRGWTLGENTTEGLACDEAGGFVEPGETPTYCLAREEFEGDIHVTATFCKEGQSLEACLAEPSGPTNLRTLTVTKSAGGTTGTGAVSSKPKGINCGTACTEAVASMYENQTVVLKAKAATGSTIANWSGCEASTGVGGLEGTCTVAMTEAQEVEVAWSGTSKAILNPQPLTLTKGEGSGKGTVKAAGLSCEAECDAVTVLYQGPTGIAPKNKPGKLVILKELPAFGSEFTGWSGCTPISATECETTMEEAGEVTAEFTAKPTTTLTVDKAGTGTGAVSSKPKAINCGTVCTTQDAVVPEGEAIVLKEKPGSEMTFTGWSGGGCSGTAETCTVSLSEATEVTASFSGSPKPILNPQELTLTKAGSGYGTVKASGMGCEALCTSTVSLYQGPTGIAPKNKPGKTVILKAISAPGTKAVEWSGCTPISPTECEVVMEEAEEVVATFDELE